jgi:hypothetical protein
MQIRAGASRRSVTIVLFAGLACVATIAVAPRARALAGEKPPLDVAAAAGRQRLVGEWKLNPELSEDPREKMRQARGEGGRSEGGGPGGWGGGRGGRGGGGWGGGGRGGWGAGRHGGQGAPGGDGEVRTRSMLLTASQITVTNLEPEITMLEPQGEVRRLHPDDQAYKDDSGAEVKAKWDSSRLVVETRTQRGSTKETWSVADDPRRLTVLLEIKRPFGGEVKVKRVFDPVVADAPTPTPRSEGAR